MQSVCRIALLALLAAQTAAGEGSLLQQGRAEAAKVETQLADEVDVAFTTAGPSDGADMPSVLKTLEAIIYKQLTIRSKIGASLVALFAFVCGAVMLADGKKAFEVVIYMGVFILSMLVAREEVALFWSLDESNKLVTIVSVEVALAMTYAAYWGLAGMKIVVGAIIGGLLCQKVLELGAHIGMSFMAFHSFEIIAYTGVVAVFMRLFTTEDHHTILAYVFPIFGGLFCSSAFFFCITRMVVTGHLGSHPTLHPVTAPWVDFLKMLWTFVGDSKDVGIFAGSQYGVLKWKALGTECSLDRLLGRLVWGLAVVVRLIIHNNSQKKPTSQASKNGSLKENLIAPEA